MPTEGRSRYLVPIKEYETLKARIRDVENRKSSLRTESVTVLEKLGRVQQETKALEGLTIDASQRYEVDRVRWAARRREYCDRETSLKEKMESLKREVSRLSARNEDASSILETRRAWKSLRTACVAKEQNLEALKEEARNLRKTVAEKDCALQDIRNELATALAPERNQPKEISPSLRGDINDSGGDVPENVRETSEEYHECGDDLHNTASNQTDNAQGTTDVHTDDGDAVNVEEDVFVELPDAHGADFLRPETEVVNETQPEKDSVASGEKDATLDPPAVLASKSDKETVPAVPSPPDNSDVIQDGQLQVEEFHQCPSEQENRVVQLSDQGGTKAGLDSKDSPAHQDTGIEPLPPHAAVETEIEPQGNEPLHDSDNCSADVATSSPASFGNEIDNGAMEVQEIGLPVDAETSAHSEEDPSKGCNLAENPVKFGALIVECTTEQETGVDRMEIDQPQELLAVNKASEQEGADSENEGAQPSHDMHPDIKDDVQNMEAEAHSVAELPANEEERQTGGENDVRLSPACPIDEPQSPVTSMTDSIPARSLQSYTPCTDFGTPVPVQSDAGTPLPMDMSRGMVSYDNALFDGEPCDEEKLARPVVSAFEKSKLEEKSPVMGLVEGSQKSHASQAAAGSPSEVSIDWGQGEASTQGVSFAIRASSEVMSMESTEQTPTRRTRRRKSWFPSEGLRRSPRIAALQKQKEEELKRKALALEAEMDERRTSVGRPRKRRRSSKIGQ
ncbi:hypothetical protein BSKO_04032 [Bryopsis sp. KO-2023]|nr:hypothetical protein BSKO_04032 [Bryopsis sp. KO-2023]